MSSKRKSTTVLEQSPKPKRRQSLAAKKRSRNDSDEERELPAKVSRKKAVPVSEDESEEASPVQSPVKATKAIQSVASPAKTPRASRNSLSSNHWTESLDGVASSRKQRQTAPLKVIETPKKVSSEAAAPSPRNYLPSPTPAASAARWSSGYEVVVDDDDTEIGFWKHASHSLLTSMAVITPVFVTMIFLTYVVATVLSSHSVAIASMGITFCLLLVLILTSFTIAILPSIYLSRMFTALVMTPGDRTTTKWPWQWKRNLNFYSTFTALAVLFVMSLLIVFNV